MICLTLRQGRYIMYPVMLVEIADRLFILRDEKYRKFHSALIPTVDFEKIIGVRVPDVRRLAKEIIKEGKDKDFIGLLPHCFYEENNLHVFIISRIKDFNALMVEIERFLPFIDNWATCDSLRPEIFGKNKERLLPFILKWLSSEKEFTVRFAIEMLMVHFLDDAFLPCYPEIISDIKSDKYYINTMIAWYFATALAERWDDVVPFIEEKRLTREVHNKTIRKAVESLRISEERKEYLKACVIK